MMSLVHYILQGHLPSFMDFIWWLDGDCFGC